LAGIQTRATVELLCVAGFPPTASTLRVKRENENVAGDETVSREASIGVRLPQESLVVIPAIF